MLLAGILPPLVLHQTKEKEFSKREKFLLLVLFN